jgi:hypothetical protein
MWDFIGDLFTAAAAGLANSGRRGKQNAPEESPRAKAEDSSVAAAVCTALGFVLLAGACAWLAFVRGDRGERLAALLVGALFGLAAYGVIGSAVAKRRRQRQRDAAGFPVVPGGGAVRKGEDRAGDSPALRK